MTELRKVVPVPLRTYSVDLEVTTFRINAYDLRVTGPRALKVEAVSGWVQLYFDHDIRGIHDEDGNVVYI